MQKGTNLENYWYEQTHCRNVTVLEPPVVKSRFKATPRFVKEFVNLLISTHKRNFVTKIWNDIVYHKNQRNTAVFAI